LIILIILGEEYKLLSSSSSIFLQPPVTSSLFGSNILIPLFSDTLSLCSSLNVRVKVSHPHKTTGKIIVLYILIFMFLDCVCVRVCKISGCLWIIELLRILFESVYTLQLDPSLKQNTFLRDSFASHFSLHCETLASCRLHSIRNQWTSSQSCR
jgi:hypothetical protein